jgi:hypothetical protein
MFAVRGVTKSLRLESHGVALQHRPGPSKGVAPPLLGDLPGRGGTQERHVAAPGLAPPGAVEAEDCRPCDLCPSSSGCCLPRRTHRRGLARTRSGWLIFPSTAEFRDRSCQVGLTREAKEALVLANAGLECRWIASGSGSDPGWPGRPPRWRPLPLRRSGGSWSG